MPDEQPRSWWSTAWDGVKFFAEWAAVASLVLFFGGVAARAIQILRSHPVMEWSVFCKALVTFSVSGGITIGLLIFALWLVSPGKVHWGLGVAVLVLVLFVAFVWPTPYKYYKAGDLRIKVNRVTGAGEYIPKPAPSR